MIRAAAAQIALNTRESDMPARLAGDEFVVLCPEASSAGLQQLGMKLADELHETGIGTSVGWAKISDADVAPGDLLARADAAMNREKGRRRHAAPAPVPTARPGFASAG